MKTSRTIISAGIALTILLASSGAVFAQSSEPASLDWGTGVPIEAMLDEYMLAALADVLGVSQDTIAADYAAGSSLTAIALANGVPVDEVDDLLLDVRAKALELAVVDGAITPDQAEWLKSVQYGANGRGGMTANRARDLTACVGTCDYSGARQYQNPMAGAAIGRGGRR